MADLANPVIYPAKDVNEFLKVWRVEKIKNGDVTVSETWARVGRRIGLFRNNEQICMFGEANFAFNSYEQFHFVCEDGYLINTNEAVGIQVKVGFADEEHTRIKFEFSPYLGTNCGGGQNGSWNGGMGNNP